LLARGVQGILQRFGATNMEFRKLLSFITFFAVLAMATRVSIASDTFWHLRAGEWILEHGEILREDPFSLTRYGEDWRYPGWLAQVLMISAFRILGFPGLNLFTTGFVLLGLFFVWQVIEGQDFVRVSILLLAAITSAVYWSARPHIMTFALTGLFLWVLQDYRSGKRNKLWILPIGMALWGNLHGGFASGFILILCYLLGEILEALSQLMQGEIKIGDAFRKHQSAILSYTGIGLICAVSLSLNPHGPSMILYPFRTVGIESLQNYIQEWQSPNFHEPQVYPYLLSILLLLLVFTASKKRVSAHEYVLTAVFLVLSLTAARNIALFALVTAPVLSKHLSSSLEPWTKKMRGSDELDPIIARRINLILFFVCALAVGVKIAIPLRPAVNQAAIREMFPQEAVEFIKSTEPEGPLFNTYNWGAYILWELYPDYPSYVDGRTDLFNDEILSSYLSAWRGAPEWQEVFSRWGIKLVFVETDAPLRHQLEMNGWETLYEDEKAIVMSHD
jgi:hypothetical protein